MSAWILRHKAIPWLILALFLTSCSSSLPKGQKPSLDWGRSNPIGRGVAGSIGMSLQETEAPIHLVWPEDREGRIIFQYHQLDASGKVLLQREIYPNTDGKSPRLVRLGDNRLGLLWAGKDPKTNTWVLHFGALDQSGQYATSPVALTSPKGSMDAFSVVPDRSGGFIAVWTTKKKQVFAGRWDSAGRPITAPVVLTERGESPYVAVNPGGVLFLAWRDQHDIFFARSSPNEMDELTEQKVARVSYGVTGDVVQGPVLGVAQDWVYILWSVLSISNHNAGSSSLEYVSFQATKPEIKNPERIFTLILEKQPFIPYAGSFRLSQISPALDITRAANRYGIQVQNQSKMHGDWVDVSAISNFLLGPSVMIGDAEELAVAVSATQDRRLDQQLEIAVLTFSEGRYQGYSIASKTHGISEDAVLGVDPGGDLHLAWREGSGGEAVYYTTTKSEAVQNLDKLETNDMFQLGLTIGLEGFTSIAFFPFIGLWWVLPGFALVGGWQLLRGNDRSGVLPDWSPSILAVALYMVMKFAFLPSMLSYVPFSAWMFIPEPREALLRIGVPAMTFAVALVVAEWMRRRSQGSQFSFYIAFAITDSLLTLFVYGVNIMGAL